MEKDYLAQLMQPTPSTWMKGLVVAVVEFYGQKKQNIATLMHGVIKEQILAEIQSVIPNLANSNEICYQRFVMFLHTIHATFYDAPSF